MSILIKFAEEKLKTPTAKELREFEKNRRPGRDAAVGALTGAVGAGVPGGLLAAGAYRAISGKKGNFKKGLKYILPVTAAYGGLMGSIEGGAGNPHFAHPIDSLSDNERRRKNVNTYNEALTRKWTKALQKENKARRELI